jgi:hypothetical protein
VMGWCGDLDGGEGVNSRQSTVDSFRGGGRPPDRTQKEKRNITQRRRVRGGSQRRKEVRKEGKKEERKKERREEGRGV